jgi:hypothetical protein
MKGKTYKITDYERLQVKGGLVDGNSKKSCYIKLKSYFTNIEGDTHENLKKFKYNFKKVLSNALKTTDNVIEKYIIDFDVPYTFLTTEKGFVNIELNIFFDDTTKSDLKTTIISIGEHLKEFYNSIDYIEIDKFAKWK